MRGDIGSFRGRLEFCEETPWSERNGAGFGIDDTLTATVL